jgi:hypothetical protein
MAILGKPSILFLDEPTSGNKHYFSKNRLRYLAKINNLKNFKRIEKRPNYCVYNPLLRRGRFFIR